MTAAASFIADKYINRDGSDPKRAQKQIVWTPFAISDCEQQWLSKAVLRSGYLPTRERDGEDAPFLSDLRLMHGRGLVHGMPWRITKLGRDCLREIEKARTKPAVVPIAAPKLIAPVAAIGATTNGAPPSPVRPIAEVERDAINNAIRCFNGNKTHAATALGISVRTIRNKLRSYGAASR